MMGSSELLVLPTGSANTASVMAGLARAGGRPHMAASPRQVGRTRAVVVPGVGAYDAALDHLRSTGLLAPLSSRIKTGQPTLLICVGLQILCAGSEESPGAAGLGLLPGRALRFSPQVRNPHMGWNHVLPGPSCRLLREGYAYFAHSYRLLSPLPGWETAVACHDGPFVAA
ncbi:MAG: imidazole glycerol phosphate synthase subunit HisH, partial [Acidobacteriota bacterium]